MDVRFLVKFTNSACTFYAHMSSDVASTGSEWTTMEPPLISAQLAPPACRMSALPDPVTTALPYSESYTADTTAMGNLSTRSYITSGVSPDSNTTDITESNDSKVESLLTPVYSREESSSPSQHTVILWCFIGAGAALAVIILIILFLETTRS